MLRKPRLLFLDEATSALDTENEALVQEALDMLIKTARCTVVLVAHRLSTVMSADQIIVLENGLIRERGKHEELVRAGELYSELFARQDLTASN